MSSLFIDKMWWNLIQCSTAVCMGMFLLFGCFSDDPVEIYRNSEDGDGGDLSPSGTDEVSSPEGCNPNHEPTWENPVDKMMQAQCTKCHEETKSYESIRPWVENGLLETYCAMGTGHFLISGKEYCLRWITLGAPKTACDVR